MMLPTSFLHFQCSILHANKELYREKIIIACVSSRLAAVPMSPWGAGGTIATDMAPAQAVPAVKCDRPYRGEANVVPAVAPRSASPAVACRRRADPGGDIVLPASCSCASTAAATGRARRRRARLAEANALCKRAGRRDPRADRRCSKPRFARRRPCRPDDPPASRPLTSKCHSPVIAQRAPCAVRRRPKDPASDRPPQPRGRARPSHRRSSRHQRDQLSANKSQAEQQWAQRHALTRPDQLLMAT